MHVVSVDGPAHEQAGDGCTCGGRRPWQTFAEHLAEAAQWVR